MPSIRVKGGLGRVRGEGERRSGRVRRREGG